MTSRYSDEWTASLLNPERLLCGLTPEDLMQEAGLLPEMTVVDYGCGPGLLTLLTAKTVGPTGKVYALDIHQGMVSLVESRAAEAGLTNVTALLNDGPKAPLPDCEADLILCTLVFHYRESTNERQALATDLARLLKPCGRAMLVQWYDRAPFEETHDLLTSAGLRCGPPSPVVERQYRVMATKPCDP
ncbi:MAG: class I SAM-dependent methyltransferase [Chloroflexi bacterium]|nr:class I SAM-dependent methyltransferase [Chloroflexota bacterium]